jgi:tRNA A37 threonylcarbamoyladenosine synthetase subunit TsaC/SUA5/YrdC
VVKVDDRRVEVLRAGAIAEEEIMRWSGVGNT